MVFFSYLIIYSRFDKVINVSIIVKQFDRFRIFPKHLVLRIKYIIVCEWVDVWSEFPPLELVLVASEYVLHFFFLLQKKKDQ